MIALGMGGFAVYSGLRWTWARWCWPSVPCQVLASTVGEGPSDKPYRFHVTYRYRWEGREHEGHNLGHEGHGLGSENIPTSDLAEAERLTRTYHAGAQTECFVNPTDPTEAILRHDSLGPPFLLAAFCVLAAWFLGTAFLRGPASVEKFYGVFLLVMGATCYLGLFGWPLARGVRSWAWRPTPCVIESSKVRSHTNGGLVTVTAHWADVVYRYEFDGQTYRANTYNASDVGAGWYYGARGVARAYPASLMTTCFVNPDDPSEAVLERSISASQLYGIWPIIITGLGAFGIVAGLRGLELKLGTPKSWATFGLGSAVVFTLQATLLFGRDLVRDIQAGEAEWPEFLATAVAVVLTLVCLRWFVHHALGEVARPEFWARRQADPEGKKSLEKGRKKARTPSD
jgi:hypothetical protein